MKKKKKVQKMTGNTREISLTSKHKHSNNSKGYSKVVITHKPSTSEGNFLGFAKHFCRIKQVTLDRNPSPGIVTSLCLLCSLSVSHSAPD